MNPGLVFALEVFTTVFVLLTGSVLVRSPLFSNRWATNRRLGYYLSPMWIFAGRGTRAAGAGLAAACACIAFFAGDAFNGLVGFSTFMMLLTLSIFFINIVIDSRQAERIPHWWKQQLALDAQDYLSPVQLDEPVERPAAVGGALKRLWALACLRAKLAGAVGLSGEQSTPPIIAMKSNGIIINPIGFTIDDFELRAEKLQATLQRRIGSIDQIGANRILIEFESADLPRIIKASAIKTAARGEIVLGISRNGPVKDRPGDWPHMMVAGTSGSGKSTFLVFIVHQLLAQYPDATIIVVDVKRKDFEAFMAWPNFVRARNSDHLSSLAAELERERERREAGISNDRTPVFIIIDEFNAVINKENLHNLERLASMGRSANFHMVFSSQRPTISDTAITGIIRENLDRRVCFRVKTKRDSMIIIDSRVAALIRKIPGRGIVADNTTGKSIEIQSPYTSREEIEANIAAHLNVCRRSALAETLRALIAEIDRKAVEEFRNS